MSTSSITALGGRNQNLARMTRMGRTEFLSLPTGLMACGPFASFAHFAAKTFAKIEENVGFDAYWSSM